ncbi:DEAD/DEAH box helicase family protein, partial [Candidatus Gribaldobacteria bacterium]|nr:DEAD/DEAH box helicase family protein [Candidatus Gribaldobacteria bacterium]
MPFLYEKLNNFSEMGGLKEIKENLPSFLLENLNPSFALRDYQKEVFARFLHCFNNNFEGKQAPLHLLFNMATGSGKTLIMAGLILYLYERGYNNFLFFVNSTNIIEKTKDNFLNSLSQKYLFKQKVIFNNKEIKIKAVSNFEATNKDEISICFTTIQKLHTDLLNQKENSLTFEDFKNKKIVLIADEAHHLQVRTRQQARQGELFEKPNWENTVEKIFKQNSTNLLLEFTATMDFLRQEIAQRYQNKTIIRYDLKSFRNDGFSKDVELLHTETNRKERILQAIILSQYRQEVALKHNIDLKPVVLFKAQKTISQSKENKDLFEKIIENLNKADIENIRKKSNVDVLQRAFKFFKENKITGSILVEKLKIGFAKNKTLSVNEDKEKEKYQLLLNSLEDKNNQIRAIFAVQKLNEGWDVLNLFDIVRLYETRDGGHGRLGKTTISEAQLIGRGARYFPFVLKETDEKYKRKFDQDLDNELRVLEELHYHHHNESRYISEIKEALTREGIYDEKEIEVQLSFSDAFKKKSFYKTAWVFSNKKEPRSFNKVKNIDGLGVQNKNIVYKVLSGKGKTEAVFMVDVESQTVKNVKTTSEDVFLKDIETQIIKTALARNDFFAFANLQRYFPKLKSQKEFILSQNYLADFAITFEGQKSDLNNLEPKEKLEAVLALLAQIEKEIKSGLTEYQGSDSF